MSKIVKYFVNCKCIFSQLLPTHVFPILGVAPSFEAIAWLVPKDLSLPTPTQLQHKDMEKVKKKITLSLIARNNLHNKCIIYEKKKYYKNIFFLWASPKRPKCEKYHTGLKLWGFLCMVTQLSSLRQPSHSYITSQY